MQGHVLSQTTRQEIHLITCEAEDGAGVGAWRAKPVFPEHSAREMGGRGGGGIRSWVYCKEGEGVYFSVLSSLSLPPGPCVELLVSNSFPAMLRSSSRAALQGPAVI